MVTLQGAKVLPGPPVRFRIPDGSPFYGESVLWRGRTDPRAVECWFLGATFRVQRAGGLDGVYTLQAGCTPNAAEVWDVNGDWRNGTVFYLTAYAPPYPRGLPSTWGYIYAARLLIDGAVSSHGDFYAATGPDEDLTNFGLTFPSLPSSSAIITANLYYQHQ